jgi:hypothetical protein
MNIHLILTHYNIHKTMSAWYSKGKNNGLGNMLFQISSGLAYANKNNALLRVPSLNTYFRLEQIEKENSIFRNINTELIKEYNESLKLKSKHHSESIYEYEFQNNMVLQSYFENYSNFDNYKEKIIEIFSPNENDIIYITEKYPNIYNDKTCSLHIRMGDDFKNLLGESEINKNTENTYKMIDYMIKNKNIDLFYVMTNDKKYCDEILKIEKYKNVKFIFTNEKDYIDLWIISLIKNNIVAPSTLSWWGSYLNKNKDRFIIHIKNNVLSRNLTYHEWINI